ncbi:hypothetical protein FA95DRAFT_1567105 [Auriscalpium vulgare]|uniref:Uncharacterized protein n=1 Tax=Auriscalpium vulgare TaxID=40419 RepID=A0ACB8R630_9AGAM|nr:hypothetical protein FA95DRAFT_1567105 [Auriscalpium vulgare]
MAAESALTDSQAFRRDQLQLELAAIEKSKKALLRGYAIQDEAAHLALLALRQKHNTLIPVARLPPEILATIFSCLRDIDIPRLIRTSRYESWTSWTSYGWLLVTYVCLRWRQVAVQHAELWRDIHLWYGHEWATRFATRAGNTLITIKAHDVDGPWQGRFLEDNMWRTQSLHIEGSRKASFPAIGAQAPFLHTLDIMLSNPSSIPDCFLGRSAPALRHMRFTSAGVGHMPWSLPPFRHLISLQLNDHFALLEDVLDGLSHMSTLERLCMCLGNYPNVRPTPAPVALAKLAHLELEGSALNASIFLRHILLPSHAIIRFELYDRKLDDLDEFFPVALESVHSHAASGICNAITSLAINASFSSTSRATKLAINARKDNSAPHEPTLYLHFAYSSPTFSTLVPMVIRAFSSAHLKELMVVNTHHTFDGHAWAHSVGRAPGLRSLTVAGNSVISFCAALRLANTSSPPHARAPGDESPVPPFLPHLSVLILSDMRLGIDGAAIDAELEDEDERLADALPLRLAERTAAGYTLQELDVVGCDVDAAWVTRTREALPGTRVKWDEGARERARAETTAT